nr:inactive protein kinase SELMODRAFT_444075-like [Tanacetum cinerariifolium]
MKWNNINKVAFGAARVFRYLREDCRVGCIVYRDLRSNNILLTHDFEPLVESDKQKSHGVCEAGMNLLIEEFGPKHGVVKGELGILVLEKA